MLNLSAHLLLGGASTACGFAALGVALYAGSPAQGAAAVLFASVGFGAGLACGALHAVFDRPRALPAPALAPQVLAGLVRDTLASAGPGTRSTSAPDAAPRSGSAADRRPSAVDVAAAALAGAAASAAAQRSAPAPVPDEPRRFAGSQFGA